MGIPPRSTSTTDIEQTPELDRAWDAFMEFALDDFDWFMSIIKALPNGIDITRLFKIALDAQKEGHAGSP